MKLKLTYTVLAIGIVSYFAQSLGPWWLGILVAFLITAMVQLKPGVAFLAGFIGLGLAWGIEAGIADFENSGILSARMGELFGGLSGSLLVVITALIGAILGGVGGLTGALGMKLIVDK